METRTKVIISVIVLATVFAIGRFTSPETIKTETKIVEVEKIVTVVKREVKTIVERPDGTKETTVVTDTNSNSQTNSSSSSDSSSKTLSKDRLNISVLAGQQFPLSSNSMLIGGMVTKNVLGPITASAWGMNNLSFGVGLGLNF